MKNPDFLDFPGKSPKQTAGPHMRISGQLWELGKSKEILENMDEWNTKQHKKTGLWNLCLRSKTTLEEAEEQTLEFIKKHTKDKPYLAGNSIWQDRRFIRKYMPKLDNYLHYRMIDVSAIKIVGKYWNPKVDYRKKGSHRAYDDIVESINELKHYKEHLFLNPNHP